MTETIERGGARERNGRFYAYARVGKKKQLEYLVPSARSKKAAKARAIIIADTAAAFVRIGRRDLIGRWAREIASTDQLPEVQKAIARILKDPTTIAVTGDIIFAEWARRVTSGEIAKQHPDRVSLKDYSDDESRLRKYILPHVRDVPMSAFSLEHADLVMSELPAMSRANRRHVAQVIHRLCKLAVYPGKIIKQSPLPKGWLPKVPKREKDYSCLFPDEEAMLLRNEREELEFRLMCGVLNREGMRLSELVDSDWWQWGDARCRTFRATKTKTIDPRWWAVRPDTARAMAMWREIVGENRDPFATIAVLDRTKLAERFRRALKASGVSRPELFDDTDHTGKLRAHDMRATFVTISLAEGKTDTWIRDRTAHKTTSMIDRYRRAARQIAELEIGSLPDLVAAIPELAAKASSGGPDGGAGKVLADTAKNGPSDDAQVSESTEGGTRTLTGKPRRILNTAPGSPATRHAEKIGWIDTSTDDDPRASSTLPAPLGLRRSPVRADSVDPSTDLEARARVVIDGAVVAEGEGPPRAVAKQIARGLRRAGLPAVARGARVHVGGSS